MKLIHNPDAPLNLGWVNRIFSYGNYFMTPEQRNIFSEFKKYWQLSLDLNQSFGARRVYHSLAEKYARELFDNFAARGIISV